jgi:DNA-directed RNA polymerase subunit RPC12/RpoP
MIVFRCPGCNKEIEVPNEYAGRTASCPTCSRKLHVPQANGAASALEEPLPDRVSQSSQIRVDGRSYQVRPKLEGMIIVSAVVLGLSVICFLLVGLGIATYAPWVVAGLVGAAVGIFGALLLLPAYYNIRRSGGRKTGIRMAMITLGAAALLVVFFVCASLVSLAMTDRSSSAERLRAVHAALLDYAGKNGDSFPPSPQTLVDQKYLRASKLTCPDYPGIREGQPTWKPGTYWPQVNLKKDPPFPDDLIILVDATEHKVRQDGQMTRFFLVLEFGGKVAHVTIEDDPQTTLRKIHEEQVRIIQRVLNEQKVISPAAEPAAAAPPGPAATGSKAGKP